MKKQFEECIATIIAVECKDVIVTSFSVEEKTTEEDYNSWFNYGKGE